MRLIDGIPNARVLYSGYALEADVETVNRGARARRAVDFLRGITSSRPQGLSKFRHDQRVVFLNHRIGRAERNAARQTVCDEQSVEGISCPTETQSLLEKYGGSHVIQHESRVRLHGFDKLYGTRFQSAGFGEKLDFKKSHRGYPPRSVAFKPWELLQPACIRDDPDQVVSVQEALLFL